MTDEEKNLLKSAAGELCKTADLAKGFHENAKWLAQHYRTLVAELEGEIRALKYDVGQRDNALSEMEYTRSIDVKHDKFVRGELKNQIQASEVEILKLKDSVRLWGSLFAVSVCVSFFLLIAFIKGVLS